ncbi:nucleotidyltransferase domain-containing protein [Candidatus Jettenia sp. AMX1]|nr:nucleotidyltransferase domain-containing protein [Candidatus Jettenia sp. AMX1]WKZ14648.1 MAG: nucleotidyltransferase domain-containing protein [Candidatus Jettenia caeni]
MAISGLKRCCMNAALSVILSPLVNLLAVISKTEPKILSLLQAFPMAIHGEHEEVMRFIEDHRLMGKGLGYIDIHLIASALLTEVLLWTVDKRLNEISLKLGINLLISSRIRTITGNRRRQSFSFYCLLEWLNSPVIYQHRLDIVDKIKALMPEYYSPKSCLYHFTSPEDLILSKLFWAKESLSGMQIRDVRNLLKTIHNLDINYTEKWVRELGLEEVYNEVKK